MSTMASRKRSVASPELGSLRVKSIDDLSYSKDSELNLNRSWKSFDEFQREG